MEYWESYSATLTVRGLCQPTAAWGLRWTTAGHWSSPSPTATDFRKVRSMCTVKTCFAWILTLNYTRSIVAWYYTLPDFRQHPLMTDVVYPLGRAPRAPSDSPPTPPLPPLHHLPPPAPPVLLLKPTRAKCLWEACPQILTKVSLIPPQLPPLVFRQ